MCSLFTRLFTPFVARSVNWLARLFPSCRFPGCFRIQILLPSVFLFFFASPLCPYADGRAMRLLPGFLRHHPWQPVPWLRLQIPSELAKPLWWWLVQLTCTSQMPAMAAAAFYVYKWDTYLDSTTRPTEQAKDAAPSAVCKRLLLLCRQAESRQSCSKLFSPAAYANFVSNSSTSLP